MFENRRPAACFLTALALVGATAPSRADLCTIDAVPAATLLLPYFEVDLANPNGVTTLLSVNNATAFSVLAHVTMWTNWSQPTIDFEIYLTGYDVQSINLRDIFNGNLPRTADDARDPADTISPQGPISQDITFPGCNGLPYDNPVLGTLQLERLRDGHSGQPVSTIGNRCLGLATDGANIATGYITIDSVSACSLAFPQDPGYFVDGGIGIANNNNYLWGDFFIVDQANNFALGENLVHIEANDLFNFTSTPTGYTFYGRYTSPLGGDNREPLGTTWATRYLNGGDFTGGTDLIVWRDSTANNQPNSGFTCNGAGPNWFPLNETEVIAFDEQEDAVEICVGGDIISPPIAGDAACFPLETGRYDFGVEDLAVPYSFGWTFLNLNLPPDAPTGDVDFGTSGNIAQSYVLASHSASGRFQVGYSAIELTTACEDVNLLLNEFDDVPLYP